MRIFFPRLSVFSSSVTDAPHSAARAAAVIPPAPAPMTIMVQGFITLSHPRVNYLLLSRVITNLSVYSRTAAILPLASLSQTLDFPYL
jgi:hypothetical protein